MSITNKSSPKVLGGTIALLHLQAHTVISIDASASQTLKNEEDLIVIKNIYPSNGCHLLVVRGDSNLGSNKSNGSSMLSIGILICEDDNDDWFIAREFDTRTEEISSRLLDDISNENLKKSIVNRAGTAIDGTRIIPYHRFFSCQSDERKEKHNDHNEVWAKYLTNFISKEVLSIHGLTGKGDKIVPGTFSQDDDSSIRNKDGSKMEINTLVDGHTLQYRPIPHIDTNQSLSITSHFATRQFLASLSPTERTKFFVSATEGDNTQSPNALIFDKILSMYYNGDWKVMLGHMQLSFIVFLCCSCLSSLEHWRDIIQMLTLAEPETVASYSQLFEYFLITLKHQLFSFENDIFEDQDIMNGNLLFPSIKRLCITCKRNHNNKKLELIAIDLLEEIEKSFPTLVDTDIENTYGDSQEMDTEYHDEDDDEDRPVIVSTEEIEASIDRSSNLSKVSGINSREQESFYASKYPFLFASMMEDEDILMTCARILDEQRDVTAVREAASYLEDVEACSSGRK